MKPSPFLGSYVQGKFQLPEEPTGSLTSRNPGDLKQPELFIPFNYDDIGAAVQAARHAAVHWRRLSPGDRLGALSRYNDLIAKKSEHLALVMSRQVGTPYWECLEEVRETVQFIRQSLASSEIPSDELNVRDGMVFPHPRGVAGVISPGIQSVLGVHLHWIPAAQYGNTVVIKASRNAPLVGQAIAEIAHESGLPPGVLNIIHGDKEVARRLAIHPDVQTVFFTGSYETGIEIKKAIAADPNKICVLDMVGKNSTLLWEDAPYEHALHDILFSAFVTTGQRRTTASRILVHKTLMDRFQSDLHGLAKKIPVGYGGGQDSDGPFMGPLLNQDTYDNYIRYQSIAVRDGCEEIMRGKGLERDQKGYYVAPSIHRVHAPNASSVYQKTEIHGPNIALYQVSDLDEASELLNHPQYGLVASVYSADRDIFQKLVPEIQVGLLYWNLPTVRAEYRHPSSGIRRSGNSRPMGSWARFQCTYPMTCVGTELSGIAENATWPKSMPRKVE